tara:strand:- start:3346 stop:3693 length:348 start_codon:yes stop_codon:yes gene_type:complete
MVFSQVDGIGAVRADRSVHSAAMADVMVETLVSIISTQVEARPSGSSKAPECSVPPRGGRPVEQMRTGGVRGGHRCSTMLVDLAAHTGSRAFGLGCGASRRHEGQPVPCGISSLA